MIYVFYFVHVVVCLFLILVVLLQQGKGADLSVFGGGATQAAFGARGAATMLHKLTVGAFVAFILTTMGISLLRGAGTAGSVMTRSLPQESAPISTPAGEPAVTPAAPEQTPAEAAGTQAPPPATEPDSGSSPPSESGDGGGQ